MLSLSLRQCAACGGNVIILSWAQAELEQLAQATAARKKDEANKAAAAKVGGGGLCVMTGVE